MSGDPGQADPSNQIQVDNWNGEGGDFWAAHADQFDASISGYDARFFETLAVGKTDRVLDVGCGSGGTTIKAAKLAASGEVVGVDLSGAMLRVARERADRAGVTNVKFRQLDAQIYAFPQDHFELAISRNGTMFFADPVAAFANIASAIRPAGHLAMQVWQSAPANEWAAEVARCLAAGRDLPPPPPNAPGPFSLGDPDRLTGLLGAAGYRDVQLTGVEQEMCFGSSAEEATSFLLGAAGGMLEGLDDRGRKGAIEALSAMLSDHQRDDGVLLGSAAWLVRASAPS